MGVRMISRDDVTRVDRTAPAMAEDAEDDAITIDVSNAPKRAEATEEATAIRQQIYRITGKTVAQDDPVVTLAVGWHMVSNAHLKALGKYITAQRRMQMKMLQEHHGAVRHTVRQEVTHMAEFSKAASVAGVRQALQSGEAEQLIAKLVDQRIRHLTDVVATNNALVRSLSLAVYVVMGILMAALMLVASAAVKGRL